MNVLNYGRTAVLVELESVEAAATLHARLASASVAGPIVGLVETMPGLHTVLIRFDPALTDVTRLRSRLDEVNSAPAAAAAEPVDRSADEICVRVDYRGADLDDVAEQTGLTVADVIAAHQARQYRIVLIGMAPGFYFLAGGDPRLRVPRRSSPRTDVPKGAVGLAGELTGIYPRRGPGGWQLIGRAVDDLWHPTRLPAALLPPRFRDPVHGGVMIEIVATGPHASVQDLGRVGYAAWGIAGGGAADRGSLRLANRLVGNAEGAAAFELLLGGAALRFDEPAVIAVTGATCAFTVGRAAGRCDGPQPVPAGAVVRLGTPAHRLRTYVAVRGGVATDVVLGSRATDERSGMGRALRAGDAVPVGTEVVEPPRVDLAPMAGWPTGPLVLHGVLGPRDDYFTGESLRRFAQAQYAVDAASDRVGIRLAGPRLQRRIEAELLSEPTIRGAVEVPPDGQPIVFGADHPTTCGYPVVAVLDPPSADAAAQCRPGQAVTFVLARLGNVPRSKRSPSA